MKPADNRVCFVTTYFPPVTVGGVEKYVLYVAQALSKHGFSSHVITRFYPPLPRLQVFENITVHRVGLNPIPYTRRRYLSTLSVFLGDALLYSRLGLYDAVRQCMDIDIVHSQLGHPQDVVMGNRLAKTHGIRHAITVHGRFGLTGEDITPSTKLLSEIRRADIVIVNRNETREFLRSNGVESVCLRNPIPVSKYRRPPSAPRLASDARVRVLFIGRLTPRRGAHLAVWAFVHASKIASNIELSVVGDGWMRDQLKRYLQTHGLLDRAVFYGQQYDIRRYLWQSDIFLATSPIANSPSLSLREAMAAGLAIVATDVEETKDIISSHENGILVSPNPQDIGNAIVALSQDSELRTRLSRAAGKHAETNMDIDAYTGELMGIYRSVCSR